MPTQRLEFPGSQGYTLTARLDTPADREPLAYALFAHCFTCGKNLKPIVNINRALAERGLASLRFDFTGIGESEGDFAETDFSSNVGDLIKAAEFLEQNYAAPKILIGHSLGGAAVIQAARHVPSCVGVVTIAAPADPDHLAHILSDKQAEARRQGAVEVVIGGQAFTLTKEFFDDLEATNMREHIANLDRALLIFHSPLDNTVSVDNAAKIFQAAKHPKSFISLDQADHLLTDERDSEYVGAMATTWARRYI